MIRRSTLAEVGGFDPSFPYAEDRDLFVRLRERGVEIVVLEDVVLRRRLHDANMTLSLPPNHPLLRSLREKLARDRMRAEVTRDDCPERPPRERDDHRLQR